MKSFQSVFTKAACMLVFAVTSNSFTVTEAQARPESVVTDESPSHIRFVRVDGEMLVFDLHLKNLPENGSMLRITDGDSNTLFEEKIRAATYNVRYKIAKGDIHKINFEVAGKKILFNQSFNVKSRTEEKIEVTKA